MLSRCGGLAADGRRAQSGSAASGRAGVPARGQPAPRGDAAAGHGSGPSRRDPRPGPVLLACLAASQPAEARASGSGPPSERRPAMGQAGESARAAGRGRRGGRRRDRPAPSGEQGHPDPGGRPVRAAAVTRRRLPWPLRGRGRGGRGWAWLPPPPRGRGRGEAGSVPRGFSRGAGAGPEAAGKRRRLCPKSDWEAEEASDSPRGSSSPPPRSLY